MAKFKVVEEFVLNGIVQKLDSIIELDSVKAGLKSIQKNIEKAPDNLPTSDGSALGAIIPGVALTPEQKEKLAKENVSASAEAQQLAAEHRARDMSEGKYEPSVKTIADTLKEKLVNEEFQKKEEPAPKAE